MKTRSATAVLTPSTAFQRRRADQSGDGRHGQKGAALLGVIAGEVAGVLGVATRLLGVAAHRATRFLLGAAIPGVGAITSVLAEAADAFARMVAEIGGALAQIVGAVTDAARDVVKAVAQGLGVEPAARVDARLDPLIAGRARTLVQQNGRQPDARQHGNDARHDTGMFADLVHDVELR